MSHLEASSILHQFLTMSDKGADQGTLPTNLLESWQIRPNLTLPVPHLCLKPCENMLYRFTKFGRFAVYNLGYLEHIRLVVPFNSMSNPPQIWTYDFWSHLTDSVVEANSYMFFPPSTVNFSPDNGHSGLVMRDIFPSFGTIIGLKPVLRPVVQEDLDFFKDISGRIKELDEGRRMGLLTRGVIH